MCIVFHILLGSVRFLTTNLEVQNQSKKKLVIVKYPPSSRVQQIHLNIVHNVTSKRRKHTCTQMTTKQEDDDHQNYTYMSYMSYMIHRYLTRISQNPSASNYMMLTDMCAVSPCFKRIFCPEVTLLSLVPLDMRFPPGLERRKQWSAPRPGELQLKQPQWGG